MAPTKGTQKWVYINMLFENVEYIFMDGEI